MRSQSLVNQLVTKVHVDKYVDKSETALFKLYGFYPLRSDKFYVKNRWNTIFNIVDLLHVESAS